MCVLSGGVCFQEEAKAALTAACSSRSLDELESALSLATKAGLAADVPEV